LKQIKGGTVALANSTWATLSPQSGGDFSPFRENRAGLNESIKEYLQSIHYPRYQHLPPLVFMPAHQHTDTIHVAGKSPAPKFFDGVITAGPSVIVSLLADCLGLAFRDEKENVTGLLHISRITIGKGIIESFAKAWPGNAKTTRVAILPGICKRCLSFPVDEFHGKIMPHMPKLTMYFSTVRKNQVYVDLKKLTLHLLWQNGFNQLHTTVSKDCTVCDPNDYYWSHRRHGNPRGAVIIINE
jgi:copper oxidase (laccase) domain-containing protein